MFACPPLHLYKRACTTSTRRAPLCAMSRGWPVGPLSLPAVFLPALSPLCRSRASRCQTRRSRNLSGLWKSLPLLPLFLFFIVVAVDRSLIRNHDDEGCAPFHSGPSFPRFAAVTRPRLISNPLSSIRFLLGFPSSFPFP